MPNRLRPLPYLVGILDAGGLGFVAAATPAEWIVRFPAQLFDGEVPITAYRYTDPQPEPEWPEEPLY